MKIFVIGSTGVLGRRVVKILAKTHELYCLVRSEGKKEQIEKIGARAIVGNLYDKDLLVKVTQNMDGLLHLATAIPSMNKTRPKDWEENNRLRTEAVKILIEVVKKNRIIFYIQNSVLFSYGHRNGEWVNEKTKFVRPMPTYCKLSEEYRYILESMIEGEEYIEHEIKNGFPGIILRFGMFYSSDSHTTTQIINMVQKGKFPIIADGSSFINLIHVDDAAQAVVDAVKSYEPIMGKVFNISDDLPVSYQEFLPFLAQELQVKKPRKVPVFLAKLVAGKYTVNIVLSSYRNENLLFKQSTGWKPAYPTYKEGYKQVLEELKYE